MYVNKEGSVCIMLLLWLHKFLTAKMAPKLKPLPLKKGVSRGVR
jgi:hypothetical protein